MVRKRSVGAGDVIGAVVLILFAWFLFWLGSWWALLGLSIALLSTLLWRLPR